MSQRKENAVISMTEAAPEKFGVARRKRRERVRRKAEGKVAVTIHVDPRYRQAVRTVEAILNAGDGLAVRLLRVLAILNDALPARRRARLRLGKVSPDEAKAACTKVVHLTIRRASASSPNGKTKRVTP